jgi:hypothetical protein
MESLAEIIFFLCFFGAIGFFAYRMFRYKGLKGAIFGGEIVRTVGEVQSENRGLMRSSLKVHILRVPDSQEQKVGLEFVATSFASYQMMPILLSRAEVTKLASLLADATRN